MDNHQRHRQGNLENRVHNFGGSGMTAEMTPLVSGRALGLTRTTDGVASLGHSSLGTYSTQTPNGNISDTSILGVNVLNDIDQNVTVMQQNFIAGSSVFPTVGSLTNINGNNLMMFNQSAGLCTDLTGCNIINQSSPGIDDLFQRTTVINVDVLGSGQSTFSGDPVQSVILIGGGFNLDVPSNTISAATSNVNTHNGIAGMLFSQGLQAFNNGSFTNCCSFIGSASATPNANDQVVFSHASIRAQNLTSVSPTTDDMLLMGYDSTNGRISQLNPAGVIKRTAVFQGTTNGSGQVTFDLTSLSLSAAPICTATVQDSSTVTGYLAQINSISSNFCVVQVLQSTAVLLGGQTMVITGANRTVNLHVAF